VTLQRLIITFKPKELVVHALYRTQDGPGPDTKARRKHFTELARTGLTQALEALNAPSVLVLRGSSRGRTFLDRNLTRCSNPSEGSMT
jgi:hypothetical protein